MIRLAILGSTGSIGKSALRVVARHADRFRVVALAANRSAEEIALQAESFGAEAVVLADSEVWNAKAGVPPSGSNASWACGRDALLELATRDDVDVVLNALVGAAGLEVTLGALGAGKRLALANKESLVAGGPLVLEAARAGGGELIPVDSEHSAILQCLQGAPDAAVERLVITASGGPFRGWNRERLALVRPEEALQHPTWDMGAKITIDSATLANKALEVIEAHFLYGIDYDRIEAVVHPQSVVHSFVEFVDGSVLAQMGFPTMELPILYALSHPERIRDGALRTFDPLRCSPLEFEVIDRESFPLFEEGVAAGRSGGAAPAAFNAGNEVAVSAFLDGDIGFLEMRDVVAAAVAAVGDRVIDDVAAVVRADADARAAARHEVARHSGAAHIERGT